MSDIKKLYELERGSKLLLPITDSNNDSTDINISMELCTFKKLDGQYSVIETPTGDIVHLSVLAPLKKVQDHWELADE